tara:strand:- start:657 stop:1022 length:366 start_codon:yes stop_codon:yes gene_type:complete
MPTCYYCREEGHTVYECPNCPPCDKCGKKGHRTEKCKTDTYVHKVHAKLCKPVVKKVVQENPKNVFAMLEIELEEPEQEVEEQEVKEQEVEEQLEEPELKKNIPYFDWWEEMKDDMSYLAA